MAEGPADSYETRTRRVNDTIGLKAPDRVPIMLPFSFFASKRAGITVEKAFYDLDAWLAAYQWAIEEFEPDIYFQPAACIFTSGLVHEKLGTRQIKWPGHGVGPDQTFQFVEGEYMTAEEYEAFLSDPNDFAIRTYIPRIFSALEGLGMLTPAGSALVGYFGVPNLCGMLALPPLAEAMAALTEAGRESLRWTAGYLQFEKKMDDMGFPAYAGATTIAPFDIVSDFLRGMRGAMLDMFRHPDQLIAAEDKALGAAKSAAVMQARLSGNLRVFIPLHRGADGFMSVEQFDRFYWPWLEALVLGLIEEGLTPCPFFEGVYDSKLDRLARLPAGKVMGMFDRTDLAKAAEALADRMCIAGGMPLSLLQTGTEEQVRQRTLEVIETVGKDGGFIMTSNTVLDEAKPELVRAWVDATREYGRY